MLTRVKSYSRASRRKTGLYGGTLLHYISTPQKYEKMWRKNRILTGSTVLGFRMSEGRDRRGPPVVDILSDWSQQTTLPAELQGLCPVTIDF